MKDLQEVRSENPGYKDLSDKQMLDRMYDDHYSSMPRDEFNSKVNYDKASDIAPGAAPAEEKSEPGLIGFAKGAVESAKEFGKSAVTGVAKTMADYARGEQIQSEQMASAFVPADQVNAGPKVPTGHELVKAFNLHDPKGFWGEAGQLTGEMAINPATYFGPGSAVTKFLSTAGAVFGGAAGQQIGGTPGKIAGIVGGAFAPAAGMALMSPGLMGAAENAAREFLASEGVSIDQQVGGILAQSRETLAKEGVTALTAGQKTGSQATRHWESIFGDAPGAGGKLSQAMERQGHQFTRAVLRRIGVDSYSATPKVIDKAFDDIGNAMDRVTPPTVTLGATSSGGKSLFEKIHDVADEYDRVVQEGLRRSVVRDIADDFTNRLIQSSAITGEQAQKFRTKWLQLQRNAGDDSEYRQALGDMVEAMNDAIGASLPEAAQAEWKLLRRQYRDLMTILKASTGAGEQAAKGIITPARLRTALTSTVRDRLYYGRGKGSFNALSHAGNILMTPLPNSGTSQREMARSFATSLQHGAGYLAASIGGAGGAALGAHISPEFSVAGAAAGVAVPGAVGRATMSRPMQSYLSGDIPGQSAVGRAREGQPSAGWTLQRSLAPTLPQMLEETEDEGAEP